VLRDAVLEEQLGEYVEDVVASDVAIDADRQTLAAVLVDHREQLQGPAVVGGL